MIKYILFDVSGTLLYKPEVIHNLHEVLHINGIKVEIESLKIKHKVLTETILFPDRTDEKFYNNFNSNLIYSVGGIPNEKLLKQLFDACTYRPWVKYQDTNVLNEIDLPIGILSNFNSTLQEKLIEHFGNIFKDVLVSEILERISSSISTLSLSASITIIAFFLLSFARHNSEITE